MEFPLTQAFLPVAQAFTFGTHALGILVAAIVIMVLLGVAFGAILAYASKKFHVDIDPRVEQVMEVLPGANCGACGMPGCAGYAEAIVAGKVELGRCAPGGGECAHAVAKIMGQEVGAQEKRFAVLACKGGNKLGERFEYAGVKDCRAAALLLKGEKVCDFGCLGLGTCAEACPFDAIVMRDGLPFVIEERCTGCGACVSVCPKGLFHLESEKKHVHVGCASHDPGRIVNKICDVGCIACKKCEKECPFDAIHIENNLAVIDYEKCKACGKCVKVCPKGTIYNLMKARKARKKREQPAAESVSAA